MNDRERIYQALDSLGVAYERYAHAPAFHIDQCEALAARFHALICKNYFLSTRRKKDYCLCIVRPNARLRTSDISAQAGTSRLGFGSEEDLQALLRTRPGSVSPLGLLFDEELRVRLLVDRALVGEPRLAFHPCDNTETLVLSWADFAEKFLPAVRHAPTFVDVHDFGELPES